MLNWSTTGCALLVAGTIACGSSRRSEADSGASSGDAGGGAGTAGADAGANAGMSGVSGSATVAGGSSGKGSAAGGVGGSSGSVGTAGEPGATAGAGGVGAGGMPGSGGMVAVGGAGDTGQAGAPDYPFLALFSITEGNGVLVAAGQELTPEADIGVFYRSTNGVDWTRVPGTLVDPSEVEFGNGHFVALGKTEDFRTGGEPGGYVSDDGETWEEITVPVTDIAGRFAFGNGLFVAAGEEGYISSADGKTWTTFGPAAEPIPADVEFNGTEFLAWNYGDPTASSGDGSMWTDVAIGDGAVTFRPMELRSLNDGFIGISFYDCCLGEVPNGVTYQLITGTTASTWTGGPDLATRPLLPAFDNGTLCLAFNGEELWSGPSCDDLELVYNVDGFQPMDALESGGRYFVVGAPKGGLISSMDGVTWTKVL